MAAARRRLCCLLVLGQLLVGLDSLSWAYRPKLECMSEKVITFRCCPAFLILPAASALLFAAACLLCLPCAVLSVTGTPLS